MNPKLSTTLSWWILLLLELTLVACAPDPGSRPEVSSDSGVSPVIYSPNGDQTPIQVKASSHQAEQAQQGMVAFDGSLFVASTELIPDQWRMAGWRISDQPIDTEKQSAPSDCTLYPHLGVADQWVGSCKGHVLIPQTGASNIAVILTHPDGSTTMVQVAPPPSSP